MFQSVFKWIKQKLNALRDFIAPITRQKPQKFMMSCILFIAGGCLFVSFRVVSGGWKCSLIGETTPPCIHSTRLNSEGESEDAHKIGTVEHLQQPEAKIITSSYVESERINQKENPRSFFQEVRTDFLDFLQEIRKKRIERTGVTQDIDFANDFMEIVYWVSNLPPSPRYGSWFSLGDTLFFPWGKDKFFEIYYPTTYHYRIKKSQDPSNFDPRKPRKIGTSKDSFSQGVLSLKAEFQPPIEIRLYPKEWSKIQRGRGESL